jgi:two-component system, response regulator YesN
LTKKIVWVEDDIAIIKPLVRPLENAGYEIVYLLTVAEALEKLEQIRQADLLLFDMIYPSGTGEDIEKRYPGLAVLEMLRNEYHIDTPVIVLTVVTNPEVRNRLTALNVVDIINKPVRPSVLKSRVEQALGEG